MLSIKNLHVNIGDKPILKGINLQINPAKFTRLWAKWFGKSTLAHICQARADIP